MRTTIDRSGKFKRDVKREYKTHGSALDTMLEEVIALLMTDTLLPTRYQDHKLTGEWADFRECHIKPDLLLIYEKPEDDTLGLARLGSHSEIFG